MFGLFYITRRDWKAEAKALDAICEDRWKKLAHQDFLLHNALEERDILRSRLDQIAAQETPSANATVKRMAAIARGERTS